MMFSAQGMFSSGVKENQQISESEVAKREDQPRCVQHHLNIILAQVNPNTLPVLCYMKRNRERPTTSNNT